MRSADTHPEVRAIQRAAFRRMSGAEKIAQAVELSEAALTLGRAGRDARAAPQPATRPVAAR